MIMTSDGKEEDVSLNIEARPACQRKLVGNIDSESIHQICSNQVITDLSSAVKELLENSLDAGGRNIDIRLINYGGKVIEVIDNGTGISTVDFETLARRHHTSKLATYQDLDYLNTFGFRGEALSSLCALCSQVSISTRRKEHQTGSLLLFDNLGQLNTSKPIAREVGTCVRLENLFSGIVVRRNWFIANARNEFSKLLDLLREYGLICTGVRMRCVHKPKESSSFSSLLQTNGAEHICDNIVAIYGHKQMEQLKEVSLKILLFTSSVAAGSDEDNDGNNHGDAILINGFISKAEKGFGRSRGDRQHVFLNDRPVDLPRFRRLINSTYRGYNLHQYPTFVLTLSLPGNAYDINLTPNKRTVLLHHEDAIFESIKVQLTSLFTPSQHSYNVHDIKDFINSDTQPSSSVALKTSSISSSVSVSPLVGKKRPSVVAFTEQQTRKRSKSQVIDNLTPSVSSYVSDTSLDRERTRNYHEPDISVISDDESNSSSTFASTMIPFDMKSIRGSCKYICGTLSPHIVSEESNICSLTARLNSIHNAHGDKEMTASTTDCTILSEDDMKRVIFTQDFKEMKVIGQFNLGFIITRLHNDLFIIDQHASDEKYRYETIMKTAKLRTQELIQPVQLNISIPGEMTIIENLELFQQNGFKFIVNHSALPTKKLQIQAMPYIGAIYFTQEDLHDFVSLVASHSRAKTVNCEKQQHKNIGPSIFHLPMVTSKFASQACRSAIMIGTTLSVADMCLVVSHMSELEQPWNCPHGRPTMRHLVYISKL